MKPITGSNSSSNFITQTFYTLKEQHEWSSSSNHRPFMKAFIQNRTYMYLTMAIGSRRSSWYLVQNLPCSLYSIWTVWKHKKKAFKAHKQKPCVVIQLPSTQTHVGKLFKINVSICGYSITTQSLQDNTYGSFHRFKGQKKRSRACEPDRYLL